MWTRETQSLSHSSSCERFRVFQTKMEQMERTESISITSLSAAL